VTHVVVRSDLDVTKLANKKASRTVHASRRRNRVSAPALSRPDATHGEQESGIDERIFVQIACYRDPECQWTLKDLFEKASNPDRVFAWVVWQYVPEEDGHSFTLETRPE